MTNVTKQLYHCTNKANCSETDPNGGLRPFISPTPRKTIDPPNFRHRCRTLCCLSSVRPNPDSAPGTNSYAHNKYATLGDHFSVICARVLVHVHALLLCACFSRERTNCHSIGHLEPFITQHQVRISFCHIEWPEPCRVFDHVSRLPMRAHVASGG